jgi:hypothetical protein
VISRVGDFVIEATGVVRGFFPVRTILKCAVSQSATVAPFVRTGMEQRH